MHCVLDHYVITLKILWQKQNPSVIIKYRRPYTPSNKYPTLSFQKYTIIFFQASFIMNPFGVIMMLEQDAKPHFSSYPLK